MENTVESKSHLKNDSLRKHYQPFQTLKEAERYLYQQKEGDIDHFIKDNHPIIIIITSIPGFKVMNSAEDSKQ